MQFKPDRAMVLIVTIVTEAILLAIATCWIGTAEIDLRPQFRFAGNAVLLGLIAGFVTAGSGFGMMAIGKALKFKAIWMDTLAEIVYKELAPIFAEVEWADILLLALVSGFCEEIFFRGVMQSQMGIIAASILFGIFHCPSPRHIPYGIWAASAGFFLGSIYMLTHSLWTPIVAHALSNFIVLLFLRYRVKPDISST